MNFVLFDVRPPDQFNQCHLQSTMHLETTDDGKKLVEQITNHIEGMNFNPYSSHLCIVSIQVNLIKDSLSVIDNVSKLTIYSLEIIG